VRPFDQLPDVERIERYTRLARKALDGYGLGDAELTWQPETKDSVFRVSKSDEEGSRTYALRIGHTERSVDQLHREIGWLTALSRDTELAVPEPVLAMDGELVRRVGIAGVPGFRSCVLLRWVRGQPLDADPEPGGLRRAGAFVGELHRHGAGFRWPDELAAPRRELINVADDISRVALARHLDATGVAAFEAGIEQVRAALAGLGEGTDVAGILHGDLELRAIRVRANRIGGVGFDRCGWGYFAADVARLFVGLRGRSEAEALRAAFLDGYREVRPIADDVIARLPAFDAVRAIDEISRVLALDHDLLPVDPRNLLERPLTVLKRFAEI